MGFWIQQSVSKGSQGASANTNTLRQPEVHVTKGMVDEKLIEMFKSSNVPDPIDIPFDQTINSLPSTSSKPPLSELLKIQHHSLWLSVQKHLKPLSYPLTESIVRVWHSRCEDDCMDYRQRLRITCKQLSFENLHDWLSAQRVEANNHGNGVSFGAEGTSFAGRAEYENAEDELSLVDGFYDPETLLQTFTHSQDLEPTHTSDPAESQSGWSNAKEGYSFADGELVVNKLVQLKLNKKGMKLNMVRKVYCLV